MPSCVARADRLPAVGAKNSANDDRSMGRKRPHCKSFVHRPRMWAGHLSLSASRCWSFLSLYANDLQRNRRRRCECKPAPAAYETVDLADFLSNLCQCLQQSASQHTVSVEMEPCAVDAGRAIEIALLINGLVTNAFKHAYPDVPRHGYRQGA